ncbi:hypothetical protein [Curtobacterium sp. L1-20]|uniref:hypothetical protein n=1 Tax=Curtobacterium sp. L1-20 TaxID=3138181 RepID=UPI003B522CAF
MSGDVPLHTLLLDDVVAVFAPSLGGRLLSLRAAGEELLWQNPALLDAGLRPVVPLDRWPAGDGGMGTWANVGGSKTWPAPQGWSHDDEWHGPPDGVLDSAAWAVEHATTTTIVMRSAVDRTTGLRLVRDFALEGAGRMTERITLENHGGTTSRWAPWEVCQVRTDDGGTVLVERATRADEVDLGTWEGSATSTEEPGGLALPVGTGVAKRGWRSGSAIAYRRASGTVLRLHAAAEEHEDRTAPFPDGGCRFELWSQRPLDAPVPELEGLRPDAHLVELEVLGRRTPLLPGDARTVTVRWEVVPGA